MLEGPLMLRFLLDLRGVDNWHWHWPMLNIFNVKIQVWMIPADSVMPAKKFRKTFIPIFIFHIRPSEPEKLVPIMSKNGERPWANLVPT